MVEFNKKSYLATLFMEQKKLEEYYRELRQQDALNNEPIKNIQIKQKLHFIITYLLKVNRLINKQQLEIMDDKHEKNNHPKIFAVTHVGRYDIEMALEAIKEGAFFLMGDPGTTYKSIDYLMLNLNGVVFVDTDNKVDRHLALEKCIKILQEGGNVLIFPEGAWNITANDIVMPLFNGTAEMALKTDAEIVPIAIEQYGKHYYMNIGKNIVVNKNATKEEITLDLRNTLASLKWNIWERHSEHIKRESLNNDATQKYLDSIMCQTENGYTVSEIERSRYHDKIPTQDTVFAHLGEIDLNKNNTFLFENLNGQFRENISNVLQKKL